MTCFKGFDAKEKGRMKREKRKDCCLITARAATSFFQGIFFLFQ